MLNQTFTKYIGIGENKVYYHPHSNVLKQGKATCIDQKWTCLSRMKEAEESPLEGPKLPLTTKSRHW